MLYARLYPGAQISCGVNLVVACLLTWLSLRLSSDGSDSGEVCGKLHVCFLVAIMAFLISIFLIERI